MGLLVRTKRKRRVRARTTSSTTGSKEIETRPNELGRKPNKPGRKPNAPERRRRLLERVVKIREQSLAGDHPDRLASQHALAGVYEANGQVKGAVALLERVVAFGR